MLVERGKFELEEKGDISDIIYVTRTRYGRTRSRVPPTLLSSPHSSHEKRRRTCECDFARPQKTTLNFFHKWEQLSFNSASVGQLLKWKKKRRERKEKQRNEIIHSRVWRTGETESLSKINFRQIKGFSLREGSLVTRRNNYHSIIFQWKVYRINYTCKLD